MDSSKKKQPRNRSPKAQKVTSDRCFKCGSMRCETLGVDDYYAIPCDALIYMAKVGREGGKAKSERKIAAVTANLSPRCPKCGAGWRSKVHQACKGEGNA